MVIVSPGCARSSAAASVGTGVPGRTTIWSATSAAASMSAGTELALGGETEDLGPGEEGALALGGERASAGAVGHGHHPAPHRRGEPLAPHEDRGRGGDEGIGV